MKEIIIKIPEVLYSRAINGELTDLDTMFICGAVAQSTPLQAELEEIKAEIKDISKTLGFINHTTMVCDEDTKLFVSMEDIEKMFVKHISELKGENNDL